MLQRLICFSLLSLWLPYSKAVELPDSFIRLQPGSVFQGELGEREVVRFYFVLDRRSDVLLESSTPSRTNNVFPDAVLFYPDGRVITRDWSSGEGRNFRIRRQLDAGTYVLRVEDGRGCGSLHGCPEINRRYMIHFEVTESSAF
ncbi:hypothetical protein [Marinospirillum alkaliphilum]|uniref:Pre-peptidase C-terminal domain-containing protein n=1 Tax=Marinospirillum alkaliphilum DSM 21637 TaxID=1122209 RepID=A0A1K1ZVN6_9GAMM|nr:hypothetical protein [Marinospirillum alkaliphilum]SFX78314.1 hypothetical protein SAMN02745752_02862 [Marinospirillum alkaliphilum DSM 21637]